MSSGSNRRNSLISPQQSHYRQAASQSIEEHPIFGRYVVGEEDAAVGLKIKNPGEADAGADGAGTSQMVLDVVLLDPGTIVVDRQRGENRDRRQGQLLQDARAVEQPHKDRAKF